MTERQTIDGTPVYRVPEANMDALQARVGKLNRRALKLGMSPLVLTERGEEFGEIERSIAERNEYGETEGYRTVKQTIRMVLVTLQGTCPVVNGWQMAATIQHEEGGNVLRTVPGFERTLPQRYRTADTACEHCGLDRRRNDTYILVSDAGAWKQVGRNCLADFLRSSDASGLAEMAEILAGLDSEMRAFEESMGGQGRTYFSALELLTQVACCIRADGWCSRTMAKDSYGKVATVDDALCCMDPKWFAKQSATWQESHTCKPEDTERATAAIEWARALDIDVANDYLWNIRVVSQRELISARESGLAGSIIAAYNRAVEQELKRKYERAHPSEWFGEIGARAVYTLTVTGLRDLESQWGLTTLVMMTDASGNKCKWFCSGSSPLKAGETYTVKATVREHETWTPRDATDGAGVKTTVLSRVSVYDAVVESEAKAAKKLARKAGKAIAA